MRGILFSQMEPPEELESEFNDWYETEHIPVRLAIPGFAGATRYRAVSGDRQYLAIYEISDFRALDTPAYQKLKTAPSERTARMLSEVSGFTRFTCEETSCLGSGGSGEILSAVAYCVPDDEKPKLAEWYETEHTPMLLKARDWLRVRRYTVLSGDGGPWTQLALHDLRSAAALDSPERRAARAGPKRKYFEGKPWFENSGRWLYRVISRHGSSRQGG